MMNTAKGNQCEQADGWFLKEAEWTFEKKLVTLYSEERHTEKIKS